VDLALVKLGITERFLDWFKRGSEEIGAQLLETSTGDGSIKVDALEERVNFDGGLSRSGQGSLRSLASGAQTSEGSLVCGQVLAVLSLELLHKVVDHSVVKVFAAQVRVTSGRFDLEDAIFNGEDGDIEGSSAKIEDEDVLLTVVFLIETVGDGSGRRFVDDSHNVHAGDRARVLGGLTLRVVEVSWYGDDGVVHLLSEVGLGDLLHLDEHHTRDLLGEELFLLALVLDLNFWFGVTVDNLKWPVLLVTLDGWFIELSADESFGVEDRIRWVHGDLILGGITDKTLAVVESNIRRRCSVTLVVGDDFDLSVLEDANATVGGS